MTIIDPSQNPELAYSIFKEVVKEVVKTGSKPVTAVWQNFQWRQAENIYREKLVRDYGFTRILGKMNKVPLDKVFTRVVIWNKTQAERRFTVEQMEEMFKKNELESNLHEQDGVEVVQQKQFVFLLGKPGAGKTTFLRWLTTQAAQRYFDNKYLPIFITLKEVADSKRTLLAQIIHEFEDCHFPNAEQFVTTLLKRGNALILLDGLDEIQAEESLQDSLINDVLAFVKRYDENRYVMTCRVAALNFQFERFDYVEMSNFDEERIDEYIDLYFSDDPDKGEECRIALQSENNRPLRDLAKSPLLLSLLCLNYEEQGTFPLRRIELYEEALTALLLKWDNSRKIKRDEPYKQLFLGRKKQLYSHLAYQNFVEGKYFIPTSKFTEQAEKFFSMIPEVTMDEIEGEIILQAMAAQHGIIIERANQIYAFSHLTFQEYYTSKYIIDHINQGTLEELLKYSIDRRWREVFLLTVSQIGNADDFFQMFLDAIDNMVSQDSELYKYLKQVNNRSVQYNVIKDLEIKRWNIFLLLIQALIDNYNANQSFLSAYRYFYEPENASAIANSIFSNLQDMIEYMNRPDWGLIAATEEADALSHAFVFIEMKNFDDIYVQMESILLWSILYDGKFNDEIANTVYSILEQEPIANDVQVLLNSEAWELYSKSKVKRESQLKLAEFILAQRGVNINVSLNKNQLEIIRKYLQSSNLILECLELAVVTDREGIKAQILTPRNA